MISFFSQLLLFIHKSKQDHWTEKAKTTHIYKIRKSIYMSSLIKIFVPSLTNVSQRKWSFTDHIYMFHFVPISKWQILYRFVYLENVIIFIIIKCLILGSHVTSPENPLQRKAHGDFTLEPPNNGHFSHDVTEMPLAICDVTVVSHDWLCY